uniref:Uncharacterized protein n=1 Tax=viral metagenome TaxID=1070528 RepID=A0A6H1Z7N9_9ZZZZ
MRGLAQGEQSTAETPVLQLLVRSGELLTDLVSGTYRIEDIHDPTAVPVVKVLEAPIDIVTQKLSTGRYVILTGATAAWSYGTHRAICSYKLSAAGRTYYQVIEFEVLNPTDWPVSRSYVGYASTAKLIGDGYVGATTTPQSLHRHVARISRQIEQWTGRFFDARYQARRLDGAPDATLHRMAVPLIALELVQCIYKTSENVEQTYDYDSSLIQVYNRHLDGLLSPDDRERPRIVRLDSLPWPNDQASLKVTGVFGYTDPELSDGDDRTGIGQTPDILVQVVGSLLYRYLQDPTLSNPTVQQASNLKSMKTRDQAVTFGVSDQGFVSFMTGDSTLDRILIQLSAPPSLAYAGRRFGEEEFDMPDTENFET